MGGQPFGNGDWNEWGKHVLTELKRLSESVKDLSSKLGDFPSKDDFAEIRAMVKANASAISDIARQTAVLQTRLNSVEKSDKSVTWKWLIEKFGPTAFFAIIIVIALSVIKGNLGLP